MKVVISLKFGCTERSPLNTISPSTRPLAPPNFREIAGFIEERGLGCKWFGSYELEDIGSIITVTKSDAD